MPDSRIRWDGNRCTKGNMDRFNVGFNYVSDDKWTEIYGERKMLML